MKIKGFEENWQNLQSYISSQSIVEQTISESVKADD